MTRSNTQESGQERPGRGHAASSGSFQPPSPDRHFAWQLFSAGPTVHYHGKSLNEVPVAVSGTWAKGGRQFSITPQDLHDMVQNFEKRKNDMVVIDYEHASEQPDVARGGPIPAAGWIHALSVVRRPSSTTVEGRVAQDVLIALVEWTPEARELIRTGQYRFFSPSINWGASDKESGRAQGATLTSGALTNHPFLEELPPLMLTDLMAASGLDGNDRAAGAGESGGGKGETRMETRRLTIRKLTEGPQSGHHGVFFGDEFVGYMTDEDFSKYVEKHPPCGTTDATALSVMFAEQVGAPGAALEEIRLLIDAGRRDQAQEMESTSRKLILSEVVRDGRVRTERALELAREQKITLADFVSVQAADRALDGAVEAGKILPRDRKFFFRDALERPREFAEFVERAVPLVRFSSDGIGSGEPVPVDQEVDLGARRLMSEQKISYGRALKALFRENPLLETRYRKAHSRVIEQDEACATTEMAQ